MKNTFGFIGTGNMGGALASAAAKAVPKENIYLANRTPEKARCLGEKLGCKAVSVEEAARCGYLFLGVKPQMLGQLLAQLAPALAARQDSFVLVSMAAGVTMADIRAMAGGDYPVIRIMPNTPVAVSGGTVLYDCTDDVTPEMLDTFCDGLHCAGLLDRLPEKLMDAGTAVAGCGPAFACLFIEALADGGVACGLPRDKAMLYARQMLLGTAQLAIATGQHPGQLKDAVCSPGGSTIAGVQALEDGGFRAAAIQAVRAAFERTRELGQK